MSLLEKLKAGKRNIKIVKFPRTDQNVAIQVLSNQEIQDSIFAAENIFKVKEQTVSSSTFDAYEDERTTQILFRALRDPEDAKIPFAATVDELRKNLDVEKDSLIADYNALKQECSPQLDSMTDDDFEKLWEDIKKNPEIQLSFLNSGLQRRLLQYLASRPATSQKASGSTS